MTSLVRAVEPHISHGGMGSIALPQQSCDRFRVDLVENHVCYIPIIAGSD